MRTIADDSPTDRAGQRPEVARYRDGITTRRRWFTYVAMFAILFFTYLYLRDSTWRGNSQLHTLMETVATVLSLAVGSLALVRYYSKKDNNFLFIGTGFVATAFLDGYHTVVSSSHFIETFPSAPPALIAWSWFASRIFLSLLLWMSWLFWRREDRLGAVGRISEKLVYSTVAALALVCFAIVAFVPMPAAYYQQLPFPRPQEFLPALFFLLALIGYLRKGKWKTNMFEHWLVLSLIVGFMGQAMFMSFSGRVYDMMFDAAHLLKDGSYICVMIGLLYSMQRLFSESYGQQELQLKNTILATQQEISPDAILVVDEHGIIISYNQYFVELWGLTQEMVAARVDEAVLHSVVSKVRDPETFLARVDYLYQHRSEKSHEEIDLKDGRIIDRYSASIIGEHGKYYGRVWFFRDITERKQAEQLLSDSENRYRNLIETTRDWVWEVDENTVYTYVSPRAFAIIGYQPAELIGKKPFDLMTPDEAERVAALFDPLAASQQAFTNLENTCIHKDGHPVVLETSGNPVIDLDGKFRGYRGIDRDITERKQAEQTAMDERNFSNTLIASQPDLFFVLDQTGRFIRWNDKVRGVLGHSDAELADRNALDAVHDADRPAAMQKIQDTFEHGTASIDARLITKTGIRDYVFNAASADTDKGKYLVGVGTDITERKQAEQKAIDESNFSNTLIASQPDIFYVLDQTGLFIRWNKKIIEILGLSDTQLAVTNALDTIYEADRPVVAQKIQEAFEYGLATIEARLITKTGIRDYVFNATSTDTGKGMHLVGVGTDITARKQMETELRESELAYRTLSQNLPGMVYRVHLRGRVRMQFYNEMPVQLIGYTADELTAGKVCSIERLILDEDRPNVEAEVMRAIAQKRAFMVEYRLKHKDGSIRWMAEHGMPVYDTDSAPLYIDGVIFDITVHKQDEIELKLFRTLLDNSSDAIEVIDPVTMRLLDVNETECRELGYSREELLTMSVKDIEAEFTENQILAFKKQILEHGEGLFECMHRRKDDTTYPVEVKAKMVEIGKPYMLSLVRDITERKLAEAEVQKLQEQLREQALHDPLTGLYNRRYLDETVNRELTRATRYNQPLGIVMCDLDHFKLVNDTHGHLAGDEVLRVFAELLKKHARDSDIICRFGGEEFVLFLPDMPPAVAYQRAEQLRTELAAKRITLGPAVIQVTASFGVAAFPENGKTMDSLVSAVDTAMYCAKEAGRNRVVVALVRAAYGSTR